MNRVRPLPLPLALSLSILVVFSGAHADLNSAIQELQQQKNQVHQNIEPLEKESKELSEKNAAALAEQAQREERIKEIEAKKNAALSEVRRPLTFEEISEILLSGKKSVDLSKDCQILKGKEPNELYVIYKSDKIRIVFANSGEINSPFMTSVRKDDIDYHLVVQPDFDPMNPNKKTGPMKADITFLSQNSSSENKKVTVKVVDAKFRGESIGDGFLGSSLGASHTQKGITCVSGFGESLL